MDSSICVFGHVHLALLSIGILLKIIYRLANSVDPDEMAHYDLHCLHRYLYWFTGLKGLRGVFVDNSGKIFSVSP